VQPPEDKKMDIREHLSELKSRTIRIVIAMGVGIAITFQLLSDSLIKELWLNIFSEEMDMVIFSPTEWFMAKLVFSFVFVFFVLYPYIVYEIYSFAKPGLYENERAFVRMFLPFSYILFLLGTALAYFIVIPRVYSLATLNYFGAEPFLSVKGTLYGVFKIFLAFGLAFQIPVIAVIAVKLDMITSEWLRGKRLIIYIAVFILATNITFDISGFSQLIILGLVVIMYELSIMIASLMEKASA
jgi:sec-independent protein translocase protein TatC